MTDIQLRGLVLQHLYSKRGDHNYLPKGGDFNPPLQESDLIRICDQLLQHGLVNAKISELLRGGRLLLVCNISARGVDVVETGISPDLRIDLMTNQTVNISGSSYVTVGNNNQISIQHSVQELVKVIESSNATPEQKAEAKGLLRQFLEHPLLASIAGAAIGLL
ncbi:hypothetical protein [Acidovorax sp. KKS102]|uniref:hypothetical protein n=1 Tax=Acidovorax sp. KKS102 TaxID=358220 RepID=UPI0011D2708C|nr:hypothetical protein [Acidovorax sp. KKS102]